MRPTGRTKTEKVDIGEIIGEDEFYIEIYPKAGILVNHLIYEALNHVTDSDTCQNEVLYRMYTVNFGRGNINKILILRCHESLNLGMHELHLRPIKNDHFFWSNPPSEKTIDNIIEAYNLPETEENKIDAIKALQDEKGIILELGSPLKKDSENLLMELNDSKISRIIEQYLTDGMTKDDIIVYTFRGHLPSWNAGNLDSFAVMNFRPHTILVTNASTSKTRTSKKVGISKDEWTPANLLGFSDANNVNEGSLNNTHGTICLEEEDKKDDSSLGKLIQLMDTGKVTVSKGKKEIITISDASFIITANSSESNDNAQNIWDLERVIQSFGAGNKTEALGRRIGFWLYGNFKPAEGNPYEPAQIKALQSIVEYMLKQCTPKFETIFCDLKIQRWLNKKIPEFQNMWGVIKKQSMTPIIRDFLKGFFREGYRHTRGFAFSQALIDNLKNIHIGENPLDLVDSIIIRAEMHLKMVVDIMNRNIEKLLYDGRLMTDYSKIKIDMLSPAWLNVLIRTLIEYRRQKNGIINGFVTVFELASLWESLPDDKKPREGSFERFSNIIQKFTITDFKNEKISIMGLKLMEKETSGSNVKGIFVYEIFEDFYQHLIKTEEDCSS